MFLLGIRIQSLERNRNPCECIICYRLRPTILVDWRASNRTFELSQEVLSLLGHVSVRQRLEDDSRKILADAIGLNAPVASALSEFFEEQGAMTFQVPSLDRILVEQIEGPLPTYIVTTCRGRAFNMALGYLFAGIAAEDNVMVHEISFDENGFMIKLSHEVEISRIPKVFRSGDSIETLKRYLLDSQLFAKRFREVSSRSMLNPRRIGGDEVSPSNSNRRQNVSCRNIESWRILS